MRFTGLGYTFPTGVVPAVHDVWGELRPGELVLLTGPTGCGKSTLLRLAAGLLQRHGQGTVAGSVELDVESPAPPFDPGAAPPSARVRRIAFVGQDPDDQRVSATTGDEVAFAAESAGLAGPELEARVRGLLRDLGLPDDPARPVEALSSGQRQRLAVAAALAAGAEVLLLDEPLAHLDPAGAIELVGRLRGLADQGRIVLVVEHRLEAVWPAADRVWVMDAGAVVVNAPPANVDRGLLRRLGLSVPPLLELYDALGALPAEAPLANAAGPLAEASPADPEPPPAGRVLLSGSVAFRYPGSPDGIEATLELRAGERVALVGPNGAGKTTLLRAIAGELGAGLRGEGRPDAGRLVSVPPNPDLSLFLGTVAEELAYAPAELALPASPGLAEAFSLTPLLDRAPQALSRGQRLRVAVAAALAAQPTVLFLDEPTAGQDHEQVERLMAALTHTLREGALVFATHDLSLAARVATRVVVIEGGRVVESGAPGPTLLAAAASGTLRLPPLQRFLQRRGLPLQSEAAAARSLAARGAAEATRSALHAQLADDAAHARRNGAALLLPRPPEALTPPAPAGFDPRTGLVLVGLAGVLAVVLESPRALGALTALCALAFLRVVPSLRRAGQAALVALGIVWSTMLSQGLFYADEPRVALLHAGPLTVWREGLLYGLTQSLRFVALSFGGLALALACPPERLFVGLRALRVPFGLAFLVVTALRFVPDVAAEWWAVRAARARRGRAAWKRAPWAWLSLEVLLLVPVVARTLRRARALAESLDARGFDASAPRAVRRPLRWRARDLAVLAVAAAVTLGAAGARLLFVLYTAEVFYHPGLRGLYAAVRAWG